MSICKPLSLAATSRRVCEANVMVTFLVSPNGGKRIMKRAEDFKSSARVRKSIIAHQGQIFYRRIGLNGLVHRRNNPNDSHYLGRTEAFTTKIGLSICATIGWCSLRDELPKFGRSESDRRPLDRLQRTVAPDTRIFSPLAVSRLCVTNRRYWYLFKRLTAVSAGRFYRFEHIVVYSSGKVVAKSKGI